MDSCSNRSANRRGRRATVRVSGQGQSPQQQKSDEAACDSWAVQQSGFDPAKPQPQQQAAAPPTTATGTTPARVLVERHAARLWARSLAGTRALAQRLVRWPDARRAVVKTPPRGSRLSNSNRRARRNSRRPSVRRAPRVWKAGDTPSSERVTAGRVRMPRLIELSRRMRMRGRSRADLAIDADCGQHLRMRSACASRFALAVLGLVVLLFAATATSANGAEPKRILFVNSFAPGTSPFAPFNSAFREHMLRAWPAQVAFYEVSLDVWSPGVKENEDALVQVFRSRFSNLRMDLVVARGIRAGQFSIKHRDELFPERAAHDHR